jgi:hypothetical protein
MVQRTTVVLPDDLLNKLRRMAHERGISFAALLREAAEEKARNYRPKPTSGGSGYSGHSDTSVLAGEIRAKPRAWRSS